MIIMGQSPSSEYYNDQEIGLPLIQGNADISNGKSSPRIWTSQITKLCEIDDILLSVRAPVGEVSISLHRACIGRGICSIRYIYPSLYLYYYLLFFKPKWINISQGSTFDAVTSNEVKKLLIPVPPLQEQQNIANILTTWDRAIDNLEKLIDAKQRLKKGLMQQLLTGKLRFPEYGDPINRGNDLPSGWKIKQLGIISEVLVSSVDKKIKKNEKLVFLCNYMDVYSNEYIHKDMNFMRATAQNVEIEKYKLKKGDVLLTKDSETSDDIASMAVVIEDIQNLLCGYHLAIIRPVKKEADSIFLSKTLSIREPHRYFQAQANGVTRFGLTISSIKNVFVRLPILEEQEKIRDALINVDEEISLLEKNKQKFEEQKQGLMEKLLTGKVRAKV